MPIPAVQTIEYYLPSSALTNSDLARDFPDWSVDKIEAKTGIAQRRIAASGECASDLAYSAATRLFESGAVNPSDIDFVLLCTQSPDYFLPTTACVLQHRLNVPMTAGALDVNLGCSGFVYGLGLAKGLVSTGQARNVLLLTAETYSKFIHASDKSVRTIFGDGAAATLVSAATDGHMGGRIGQLVYGTDGSGAEDLIVKTGGSRCPTPTVLDFGAGPGPGNLYMNGPEIFNFTLRVVPQVVKDTLERSGKKLDDISLFVFHQANLYMLEHLRRKLRIAEDRFMVHIRDCANTVSSTIPIALKHAMSEGRIRQGDTVMLVGFGVGYSWAATLLEW